MESIDHLNLIAKHLFDRRKEGLGHVQHDHFDPITFGLRAAVEPGHHLLGASPLEGGNGFAVVQVDDQGIIAVALAPRILINTDGSTQLAGAAASTPFEGPAKHGAF